MKSERKVLFVYFVCDVEVYDIIIYDEGSDSCLLDILCWSLLFEEIKVDFVWLCVLVVDGVVLKEIKFKLGNIVFKLG